MVAADGGDERRERLIGFLRDRVSAYASTGDATVLLDPEVERIALDLARPLTGGAESLAVVAVLAGVFYLRYQHLPDGEDAADLTRAVAMYRIIHAVDPERVPHDLRAVMPAAPATHVDVDTIRHAALSRMGEALRTTDAGAAVQSVRLLRLLVDALPDELAYQSGVAADLAAAHGVLYGIMHAPDDLDSQIDLLRACDASVTDPDRSYATQLGMLGDALYTRFRKRGVAADLGEAIDVFRRVLDLTDDTLGGQQRFSLGRALLDRDESERRSWGDLDSAIEQLASACVAAGEADQTRGWHYMLGQGFERRYGRRGRSTDLDAAIDAYAVAAGGGPASEWHGLHLAVWTGVLLHRALMNDNHDDGDTAIAALRAADTSDLHGLSPEGRQNLLALAHLERYVAFGDAADVATAVDVVEDLCSPRTDVNPTIYQTYASALALRHRVTGDPAVTSQAPR